jgi:hypothetical protein
MIYTVVVESPARKDIDQAYRWMEKNVSTQTATLWYLLFGIQRERLSSLGRRNESRTAGVSFSAIQQVCSASLSVKRPS